MKHISRIYYRGVLGTLNCFLALQPLHSDPDWGKGPLPQMLVEGTEGADVHKETRTDIQEMPYVSAWPKHSPLNLGGLFKPPDSEVWFSP